MPSPQPYPFTHARPSSVFSRQCWDPLGQTDLHLLLTGSCFAVTWTPGLPIPSLHLQGPLALSLMSQGQPGKQLFGILSSPPCQLLLPPRSDNGGRGVCEGTEAKRIRMGWRTQVPSGAQALALASSPLIYFLTIHTQSRVQSIL